jgi:hypothetical protein
VPGWGRFIRKAVLTDLTLIDYPVITFGYRLQFSVIGTQ